MSWVDSKDASPNLNLDSISSHTAGFNTDDDAQSETSLTRVTKNTHLSPSSSPPSKKDNAKSSPSTSRIPSKPPPVDLSKFKSSFEKNHWSDHNEIWRSHIVHDPRLPTPQDSTTPWDVLNFPRSIDAVLGRENRETKISLNTLVANGTTRNVILHGPAGCGKTAMVKVFVKEFYTSNVLDGRLGLKDCVYETTGQEVAANVRKFTHDVEHWKKKLDHKIKKTGVVPPMKIIIIDNLDKVPSGKQQNVRMLIEAMDEDGIR